jgi:hypothetical protein
MHYGPGVNSASNRNEYQGSSWGKRWLAHKADNLTAICEPTVYKLWESQCLTTLWASMACYGDSFTFFAHQNTNEQERIILDPRSRAQTAQEQLVTLGYSNAAMQYI